jgi:enterobactin synthetase component D / holo-[acyl-carrier protein] synthase
VLDEVLPACAVAAEAWQDLPTTPLFAGERRLIARAVEKRRREFATARACAHRALRQLGVGAQPIGMGAHGEPLWPRGVVGSLTHCNGYRAAAVARSDRLRGLGIDAEPHLPLPSGLLDAIAGPGEIRALGELAHAMPEVHWDRLAFSAKESLYKAWFPLTRQRPQFHDAHLVFDPRNRTFSARLTVRRSTPEGPEEQETAIAGRWLTNDRHILTAVALAPLRS